MTNPEFKALLRQYNTGNCSDEEKALIESWYMEFELAEPIRLTDEQIDGILAMQVPIHIEPRKKPLWKWISVAAAILIVVSTGIYLTLNGPATKQVVTQLKTDAEPGTNKAILTLANGKEIVLNNAQTGVLASEVDATIRKTEDGRVVYSATDKIENQSSILYNTMTVPRGGQYHLTLADGTEVWLNASSSITYPIRFVDNERKVEITGEAYFEVARQNNQPFQVVSRGQVVEVLGTHFNINAYDDEPVVKTTLLEGSVKVSNLKSQISILIQPGEQSILTPTSLKVVEADLEEAMAWHNGDFVFNSQNLEEIMRNVSRWYDVDIDYEHYKPNKQTFTGVVSRSRNLSAVINMLKKSTTTLKFDIQGKSVRVGN